jgi:hypothetical protein
LHFLVLPRATDDEVGIDIIHNLIRTAGINPEAFLELLDHC